MARKKIGEEVVKKDTYSYSCDACKKEYHKSLIRQCYMCHRDICKPHLKQKACGIFIDNFSDYPDFYCRSCWDAGEEFRKQIAIIQEEFDNNEDKILKAWEERAREWIENPPT